MMPENPATTESSADENAARPADAWLQERFLSELNQNTRSLDVIFEDLKISLRDVGRWLHERKFRRSLAELLRAARKLREVETERAGLAASIKFLLAVFGHGGFKSAFHKKNCQDAMRNASTETRKRATKIVKDFLATQRGPGGLAHPDVAHFADRLVDELESARRREEREEPVD
jgi:hypothetical protein